MKPSQQRYLPPSRRGEHGKADIEQRGLEGAAASQEPSRVRLVLLREGEHDIAGCPLDIEAEEGATSPVFFIYFPERLPAELLQWFSASFPDGAGRLEFSPSLSKQERAWWHHAADRLHLHTQSVGVGDGRYLTIATAPSELPTTSGLRLTREQQQRARAIYNACQMEGGKYWERSRGEIEAMVASEQQLTGDLQELVERRHKGEQVNSLLRNGKPSEALSLLAEDPRLAWVKDGESGGYPIHIAAWKGYESVMLFLASLPGCLQQRDGRRDTALAVARRRRHTAIEELLLEAGASPEHASFQGPPPPSSSAAGAAGAGLSGEGEQEDEYMSWSREERLSYCHGGQRSGGGRGGGRGGGGLGPPPGLQPRTEGSWQGGGQGVGRGGRGSAQPPGERQQHCPW